MNDEELEARRRVGIPAGAIKICAKLGDATAYIYSDARGRPCARMFIGRAWRPRWRYRFASETHRERMIRETFDGAARQATFRAELKAKAKAAGRGVKPGDVLRAMWGYDQTNVDYYQVTALIGRTMVEIREIAQESADTEWLQGKCVPAPGSFIGEPMRRKAAEGRVKIDEVRTAYLVEPMVKIAGKPVYAADSWTAYH